MKKAFYWVGMAVLLMVGGLVSFRQMLPICNPVPFLMGLLFVWSGLMILLKMTDYWTKNDDRLIEVLTAVVFMGFGAAYVLLSLTEKANEGMTILLVSVPFILAMAGVNAYGIFKQRTQE